MQDKTSAYNNPDILPGKRGPTRVTLASYPAAKGLKTHWCYVWKTLERSPTFPPGLCWLDPHETFNSVGESPTRSQSTQTGRERGLSPFVMVSRHYKRLTQRGERLKGPATSPFIAAPKGSFVFFLMLDHTNMVGDRQTDAFYVKWQNLSLWNPGALLFIGNQKHEPSPSQRQVSNKQRLNIGSHRCPWFSLRTKGRKLDINSQRNSSAWQGSALENCAVRARHEDAGVNAHQKAEETLVEPHSPFVGLAPQQFIYFSLRQF